MKIKIVLFVLLVNCFMLKSQNRLQNGGFESGNYIVGAFTFENYINGLSYWDEDAWIPDSEEQVPTWHSPDWMDETDHNNIFAHNGTKCCGIYTFEVVEQKLTNSNKLEPGKFYLITSFIKLHEPYDINRGLNGYEDFYLNIYLARNKIEYTSHYSCDFCSSEYKEITNNNIKTIKRFDLGEFPNQEWFELKFVYRAPEDITSFLHDYNWFGIELRTDDSGIDCGGGWILLDDISIQEVDYCSLNDCVRTTGPPIASRPFSYHSPNGPIAVDFLDNIESIENISIYSILGIKVKDLPDVHSENGIFNPIFWDGTNFANSQVPPAPYIWKMNLINECGSFEYVKTFTKLVDVEEPIPVYSPYSSILTPAPCCPEIQDILIDYNLSGGGIIEYIAANDINLQNMTIDNSVDQLFLQAGNKITLTGSISAEYGSKFTAIIKPCLNDYVYVSELAKKNYNVGTEIETLSNIEQVVIYPNPSKNGLYNITSQGIPTEVQVFDLKGINILRFQPKSNVFELNLSNNEGGSYICNINFGNGSSIKRSILFIKSDQ